MRKKFRKRKVVVTGIDKIWAADLVDMQAFSKDNNGVRYLLTVIDVFSKYGWMLPLKTKTGVEVASALKEIFKERKPGLLWTDKGLEFFNRHVKSLVELYTTENEEKSSVAERWNRTMKERMFKYFTANNTRRYIDIVDRLVENYNNTKHSSIKMTPVQASEKQNENKVYMTLYPDEVDRGNIKHKFKVGDKVRITKKKSIFEKGYTPRWTEEIFTVSELRYTDPPTYKITDMNGEEIKGSFYEPELQKTEQEVFRIEKIIRRKGDKSLVKWFGYPTEFNSWVENKDLEKL